MGETLVVTYDRGAVSAGDIAVGLADLGPVVFAIADSAHTRQLHPVLTKLGQVMRVTGDLHRDAAKLRALAPAAILTFSEPMLPATAALADALGLPFHTPAATRLLTDKVRQRERLRATGVDDVRSYALSSPRDWSRARNLVGLPAVIKPVRGEGSRDTHLVCDDSSASALLASLLRSAPGSTVVVEELLQGRPDVPFGDYVSVESLCGPQGIGHLAVTGKFPLVPPFREAGRFWPAALSPTERAEITGLVTRALTALEVSIGLTHTEVKLTPAGPRIIEVNGRLGGHVQALASQVNGTSLVRLAGLLALGRAPDMPAGLDQPRQVHFSHNTLAPTQACTLVAVHGADHARRVAGISGFRGYARPGDFFEASVMTRYLDLLWGRSDDHNGMNQILDAALPRLSYEFQFAGRACRVNATVLQGRAGLNEGDQFMSERRA